MKRGRESIESNLRVALVSHKLKLEDYFHHEDIEFEHKNDDGTIEKITRPVFLCNDVYELAKFIAQERGLDLNEVLSKFGTDVGKGKLKCGLSIIEEAELDCDSPPKKRAKYEDGIAPALHKSTSANMMQIVAMVPSIQETYNNLKIILDNLPGLNQLEVIHSHDLKVIAIMTGIQTASSTYPCPYCLWIFRETEKQKRKSKPKKQATLRTFGMIRDEYRKWKRSGGDKKSAKKFFNCIELPLIEYADHDRVIDKFPPPELHIFTGIFNHMYEGMLADDNLSEHAKKWADNVGVSRQFCPSLREILL